MNKKLLIAIPLLLVIIAAGAYEFVLPKKAAAKQNLTGTVYQMPGQFTLNLAGGHYATLNVALLLPVDPKTGPEDVPVMRAIVTNTLTGKPSSALITGKGRARMEKHILDGINHGTNQKVSKVYFTDLAVQ